MAKKTRKDILIDLLILLFVAACMLLILRTLGRNVLLEIRIRDTIGMRTSALRAALAGTLLAPTSLEEWRQENGSLMTRSGL